MLHSETNEPEHPAKTKKPARTGRFFYSEVKTEIILHLP